MWRVLRQRDFALLWSGGLISLAGDWVLFVGLPLYVYDRTGSTLATGAIFLARLLPQVLLGSVAGVFVDRWDRRRTLVAANLLLAVALVPLFVGAAADQFWLVYLAAMAAVALQQFVVPAEEALLPRLVAEDELVPANALNALNNNLAWLGVPVAGMRVGLVTVRQTAVADAYRGRLVGAYTTTMALTMALATVAAGVLGNRVGILPLLMAQVAGYLVAGGLVLMLLPSDRPGAAQPVAPHEPADMGGLVADAEGPLDHCRHALGGPDVAEEAVRLRTQCQHLRQPGPLRGRPLRSRAGRRTPP